MCIVCGPGNAHLLRAIARSHAPRPGANRFVAHAVAPAVVPPLDLASRTGLDGPADVILSGGPIVTMDPARPEAEAVAVRAGRLLAVGTLAEALAQRGRATRIVDLHGRALLPGLVNAHWHMPFTLLCEWLDQPAPDTLRAVLAQAPHGEWIVLRGVAALPHSETHPIVLTDADGAILAGNALAGTLPDHVSALLARLPLSPGPICARLTRLLRATAATGVTCLRICGLGSLTGIDDLALLRAVTATAAPLRLRATLDAALLPAWQTLQLRPGFGDDMLRVDTISAWPPYPAIPAGWAATLHADDAQPALDWFAAAGRAWDARSGPELAATGDVAGLQPLGLSLGLTVASPTPLPDGVPVSLGLDTADGPSAPLRMVQWAVQADATVPRALAAVTIDAARRCGVGDILGSLAVGKHADFAFFEADPRTAPPDALAALRCVGTWVGGREAFRPPQPHRAADG